MYRIASWNIRESHVASSRLDFLCTKVFEAGIGPLMVMHMRLWFKADKKELFFSFIYAHNRYTQRRSLWTNLSLHKNYIKNRSWCLLGDFNVSLNLADHSAGPSTFDISMREFKDYVEDIEVSDVNHSGLRFTWNQIPQGDAGTLKKINRVMANLEFNDVYIGSHAIFQPYRIPNHSPAVLKVPMVSPIRPKTFKFPNILVDDVRFQDIVRDGLRTELDRVKTDLDLDPFNLDFREEEACYAGDSNSTYFYKVVKGQISRSRIDAVSCSDGSQLEGDQVAAAFVADYTSFLGQQGVLYLLDTNDLFMNKLDSNVALDMVKIVTLQEVKEAIFSMGNGRSPGLDGYTAAFFKEAWGIVSNDVTRVVKEFFTNGTLLKDLNHIIIALIPKGFLHEILIGFGFHPRMIAWIMECVSTTSFSLSVNGSLQGFFKGKHSLRQGDPLSPYLFTLIMEVFTLMLQRRIVLLSHLLTIECLQLGPESPKSTAYFCNVLNHTKIAILQIIPFEEGRLPMKYLKVPLILTRLVYKDCKELIEKVQNRIRDWKNKSLSATGRLQLLRSVIGSMNIYWVSVFTLPTRILLDLEQLMRGFLWCQGDIRKGKAKVVWDVVCLPKKEGGLPTFLSSFNSIVDVIIARPKRRSVRGIVARLVFAASTYFIWKERNYRLFKNQRRIHNQLIECIKSMVRLKLLTYSLKKTRNVMAFVRLWKLPNSLIILDS
ncbi:hypothetical protein Tco_0432205 [Tanacetum coccineum]